VDFSSQDIWLHLRLAEDFLRQHQWPTVDIYSATAAGRPFVAHEWLSGLIFLGVHELLGPVGLSLFQALLAASCMVLLWLALPPAIRRKWLALALVAPAMYVVSFRAELRPHVFSLVGVAALIAGLEAWRRTGRALVLAWALPVQVLWTNLHGEALYAPGLMGAVALAVSVMARWPTPGNWGEVRVMGRRDVVLLWTLTLGMLMASLLNPYGLQFFRLGVQMLMGEASMKGAIAEWRGPFDPAHTGIPAVWLWGLLSLAAWACVLLRWRTRPLLDVTLLSIGTFLSVRSVRFIPEMVVIALPILARSLLMGEQKKRFRLSTLRPGWGLAVGLLAIGFVWREGYFIRSARPVALGFRQTGSKEAVAFLKASGAAGTVFNEINDGALIIHELYPLVRPVVDCRIDIYGPLFDEYLGAMRENEEALGAYLARYDVRYVLWSPGRRSSALIWSYLTRQPDWALVFRSEGAFVFQRRSPARG
jgi:hypothetical protein